MLIHIVVKQNQKGKTFQLANSYEQSIEHTENWILISMIDLPDLLSKQAIVMDLVETKNYD